jgi:hypothetical protein
MRNYVWTVITAELTANRQGKYGKELITLNFPHLNLERSGKRNSVDIH